MSATITPDVLEKPKPVIKKQYTWNVIVHNDPVNLMQYVTRVLMKVFGYDETRANKHMLEVHNKGKSVVWTGRKEKAEVYLVELLKAQLNATIEEVSDE